MSKIDEMKDRLSQKGTKLKEFMVHAGKTVAFQGNKFIGGFKKIAENFGANMQIEERPPLTEEQIEENLALHKLAEEFMMEKYTKY